jgi:hypothetical protein
LSAVEEGLELLLCDAAAAGVVPVKLNATRLNAISPGHATKQNARDVQEMRVLRPGIIIGPRSL